MSTTYGEAVVIWLMRQGATTADSWSDVTFTPTSPIGVTLTWTEWDADGTEAAREYRFKGTLDLLMQEIYNTR